jgi:hypothetical protein
VERRSFDDRKTELEVAHRRQMTNLAASFAAPVMQTATELNAFKDDEIAAHESDEEESDDDDDDEGDDDSDDDDAKNSNEAEH